MGLVLLVVIWLITFISAYFFIAKTWWLPVGASAAAAGIDHHFATTYVLMGIVFVAAQLSLGLSLGNIASATPLLPKRTTPTATTSWKSLGQYLRWFYSSG
jgi:hypothetical protein